MRICFLFWLIFCSTPLLQAGLRWEKNLLELRMQPGDEAVEGVYHYKNTGATPVSISRVINSCGCTSSRVEKKNIQPGDTGTLTAVFKPGSRTGLQKKTIKVLTDDGASMLLGLQVNIEESVTLDRSILLWNKKDPAVTRTIRLTVKRSEPLEIKKVESSHPSLTAKLETVKPGRSYLIHVTPVFLNAPVRATITMFAAEPAESPQTFVARARIQ